MKTYFLPINSSSLAHYFGCACIKAAKYFNNKPHDIQDKYECFLLLTNKLGTTETDCCLELVFDDSEIDDLIDVNNGWYLLDTKPLPISRVKKIYFSKKEILENTITNIMMSTAYIPSKLVDIREFADNSTCSIGVPEDCHPTDQSDKIKQYDRFLGALALMRLAHEPYMNYSLNYIETLSFFNDEIARQLKSCENSFKNVYKGIFNNTNGFEKILPYINNVVNETILDKVAEENNQKIIKDRITKKINIDAINDTWTYTIAILQSYGVGDESRRMRVDGLISSNFADLKDGKQEGVALCYGYNRGYSAFTKSYSNVAVKYKLESQLDYYTIESVYQYVFNECKVSSKFEYLDSWCPKLYPAKTRKSTNYVILDELIIGKKKAKVFSSEWWNGFFPKFEKAYNVLAIPIFEMVKKIVETEIYLDLQEELQEKIEQKQEEFNNIESSLREDVENLKIKLSQLELENKRIQVELDKLKDIPLIVKTDSVSTICNEQQLDVNRSMLNEPCEDYSIDSNEEIIKNAVVGFKDYTLKQLKNKVKVKDDVKLQDLLLKLPNKLFNN